MNRINPNGNVDIRSPIPPSYPSPSIHLAFSSTSAVGTSNGINATATTNTTIPSSAVSSLSSPQFSNHAPLEFSRLQRSTALSDSPSGNNSRYTNSILPTPSSSYGAKFSSSTLRNSNNLNNYSIPTLRTPELPQDLQRTVDAYRRGLNTDQLRSVASPAYDSSNLRNLSSSSPFPLSSPLTKTSLTSTITSPQTSTYLRSTFAPNFNANTRENIPLRDSILTSPNDLLSSSSSSSSLRSSTFSGTNTLNNPSNTITNDHRLPLPEANHSNINSDSQSYFARNKQGQVQVFSPLSSPLSGTYPQYQTNVPSSSSSSLNHPPYRGPRVEIIQTAPNVNTSDNSSQTMERPTSLTLSVAPQQHLWTSPRGHRTGGENKNTIVAPIPSYTHSNKLSRGTLQTVFDNLIDGLLDESSVSPSNSATVSSSTKTYRFPQTSLSSTISSTGPTEPNRLDIDFLPAIMNNSHSIFDMLQMDLESQSKSQYSSPVKFPSPEKQTNTESNEGNTEESTVASEDMYASLPLFGSPEPVNSLPKSSLTSSTNEKEESSPPRRPPFILGTTLYDFIGIEEQGELSFLKGKEIMINRWDHEEWWHGSIVGENQRKRGWFPRTYVKLLQEIPEHWANASNNRQNSVPLSENTTVGSIGNNTNDNDAKEHISDTVTPTDALVHIGQDESQDNTNVPTDAINQKSEEEIHHRHVPSDSRTTVDSYSTADEVDINNVLLSNDTDDISSMTKVENSEVTNAKSPSADAGNNNPVKDNSGPLPSVIQPLDPMFVSRHSSQWHQPNIMNPIVEEDGETSAGPTPLTRSRAGTYTGTEDDMLSIDNQTRHLESALSSALHSAIQSDTGSDGTKEKTDTVINSMTEGTNATNPKNKVVTVSHSLASFNGTAHLPSEVLNALSMTRSTSGNIVFTHTHQDNNGTPTDKNETVPVRATKTVSFKFDNPVASTSDIGTVPSISAASTYVPLPVVKLLLTLNSMGMLPTKEATDTVTNDTTKPNDNTGTGAEKSTFKQSVKFNVEDILDLIKAVQKSIETTSNKESTNTPTLPADPHIILDKEVNTIIKRIARRTVSEQVSLTRSTSDTTDPSGSSSALSVLIPSSSSNLPHTFSLSALRYENGATPGSRVPHAIQFLTVADGRRIKVLGLTGTELVHLLRPKIYGMGFMINYTKYTLRQKRLRAIKAFSAFLQWKKMIVLRRRVTKVYALGIMKNLARWRLIEQVSPRIATLGVLLRPMRDKHEAMVKRAQVASKNSAILAGLEKGVSAEETLRERYDGPRTRGIHWETMNADSVRGTIWDKSTHAALLSRTGSGRPSSIQLSSSDIQQLLPDLFAKFSAEAPNNNKTVAKNTDTPQKGSQSATPGKPTLVSVLNAEVGRLLAISIGAVIGRRSFEEIREAIYKLDVNTLGGIEKVQLLANNTVLFDTEKLGPLLNFAGNVETLVLPERFVKVVTQGIQGFRMRLNVMEFMSLLPELSASCTVKLQLLIDSVKEIMNSRRFATLLLDVILPLGNKLNAGSKGRIAAGFKISSLHKLVQTRAATGETFLQFVVAGLLTRSPTVLDLANDFSHLLTATPAALSRERVTSDLSRLEQGIRQIEALLNLSRTQKENDNINRLQPLLEETKLTVQTIKGLANESVRLFDELARWLGEDPSKTTPETILGYIQSFIAAVAKDTRDVKEKLERAAKAELRKRQTEQQQQANLQKQRTTDKGPGHLKLNTSSPTVSTTTDTYGPQPRSATTGNRTVSSPPQVPSTDGSSPNRRLPPPSHQRRTTTGTVSPPTFSPESGAKSDKSMPLNSKSVRKTPPPPKQGMHRSPSQKQLDQINAAIVALQSNLSNETDRSRGPVSPPLSRSNSSSSIASPVSRSQSNLAEQDFFVPHSNKLHNHPHPTIPHSSLSISSPPNSHSSLSDSLPQSPIGFLEHTVSHTSSSLSTNHSHSNRSSSSLSSPNSVLTVGPIAVGQILDESSKRRSGRSVQSLAEYAQSILGSNNSNVSSSLSSPVEVSHPYPSSLSTTTILDLSPHKETTVPTLPTGRRLSLVMTQAKLSRNNDPTLPYLDNSNAIELSLNNGGNISPRTLTGPSMRIPGKSNDNARK